MPTATGLAAVRKRARVLATSVLPYLTAASAVLVVLAQQLDGVAGVPDWLTRTIASAIAVIGAAVLQVRRVTPVPPDDQGLLPPKGPAVEVKPAGDVGAVTFQLLFLCLAVVCFIIGALAAHGTIVTDDGFTWVFAGLALFAAAHLP